MKTLGGILSAMMGAFLLLLFPLSILAMAGALIATLFQLWRRRKIKPQISRELYWLFGISAIIGLISWFGAMQPFLWRGKQITTFANMQSITMYLEDYHNSHGDFPDHFSDALPNDSLLKRDGWSQEYHYEHRPGAFILVSFGSDGKSDGIDYWALREQRQEKGVQRDYKADQVVSDRGWHRVGGK
jgi:hypothetical protein